MSPSLLHPGPGASPSAVWAPRAGAVDLVVGESRHPMAPAGGGWWQAGIELAPGTDYGFSLDQGPPRPDPRSRWQPGGVHGLSRAVDLGAFSWTDDGWEGLDLPSAVVYELHVGTFSAAGTFAGVTDHLDHLVDLGVGAVELMPVNQFPGRHGWGYDGVDLYAVHDAYGGPAGLAALVDACHARGLGVLVDVVYNHLGPDGNHLGQFGPYFTDRYETPWGEAVNLDGPGSDEVRSFFVDNALMWLRDYHADGLRLDAVHAFFDASAVHLLEELAAAVDELEGTSGRRLWLVAESDLNDPRLLWDRRRGGYGLDATWSDDFHHALHVTLTGERDGYYSDFTGLADLGRVLEEAYVFGGRYSPHRERRHGRPAAGLSGERFVVFAQNHDQIGNRAQGDRLSHLAGPARARVAAALVLTSPFVPLLFQGEEWAASSPFPYFCDHEDPDLARAVSEGRRREFAAFGWSAEEIPDPQAVSTFESARLIWEERDGEPHRSMLDWYRRLVELRRTVPELSTGDPSAVAVTADADRGLLLIRRGTVLVAANVSDDPQPVELGDGPAEVLAASEDGVGLSGGRLRLPGPSVAILRR